MGTLVGHVAPGFGFLVIGLWHLYNHLKILAQKGSSSYKSEPWFQSTFTRKNGLVFRRLELYLIIVGCSLSVAMELFIGPKKHQPLDVDGTIPTNHLQNFEHSSISMAFLVYAVFALVLDKLKPVIMPAQEEVVQLLAGIAFAQELLLFHLHSADHMGVEGQYHWLLQLVVLTCLVTTLLGVGQGNTWFVLGFLRSLSVILQGVWLMIMGFALWTPALIPKGCFMKLENGHTVVRCEGEESLHRAKALVNIQFSWLLILMTVFAALSYVLMMSLYGNGNNRTVDYSAMFVVSDDKDDDEDDVETHKIIIGQHNNNNNNNFVQSQGLLTNNPSHQMER